MQDVCQLFTGLELQALSRLIDMGYSRDDALRALLSSAWGLQEAIEYLIGRDATSTLPASVQSGEPPDPASSGVASSTVGLCNNGCGRTVIHGWASCCRQCRGETGPHTRTCRARALGRTSTAHQPAGRTQPAPVLTAPTNSPGTSSSTPEEDCPVCLEAHTDLSEFGSCRHRICEGCVRLLRQAGFSTCPLCRSPVPESDPPSAPQVPGYVVLSSSINAENALGFHPVSWSVLEQHLHVPPGRLAGALSQWGVFLRRVRSQAEAEAWWRTKHTGVMPCRP